MALVVFGMKCPLCGQPLEKGDELVTFPPFVANELDPLRIFSDGAFHSHCFHASPLSAAALARSEEAIERGRPQNRLCVVCGKKIVNPDDFFVTGHLVEDKSDPLYRYNYTQAHRSCLPSWTEAHRLYDLLTQLQESGQWQGRTLEWLITDLGSALHV